MHLDIGKHVIELCFAYQDSKMYLMLVLFILILQSRSNELQSQNFNPIIILFKTHFNLSISNGDLMLQTCSSYIMFQVKGQEQNPSDPFLSFI